MGRAVLGISNSGLLSERERMLGCKREPNLVEGLRSAAGLGVLLLHGLGGS